MQVTVTFPFYKLAVFCCCCFFATICAFPTLILNFTFYMSYVPLCRPKGYLFMSKDRRGRD